MSHQERPPSTADIRPMDVDSVSTRDGSRSPEGCDVLEVKPGREEDGIDLWRFEIGVPRIRAKCSEAEEILSRAKKQTHSATVWDASDDWRAHCPSFVLGFSGTLVTAIGPPHAQKRKRFCQERKSKRTARRYGTPAMIGGPIAPEPPVSELRACDPEFTPFDGEVLC
ncbi:unnamed protein product [Cladocopium goreaui]|uniref:Uncharacterized protein n=1 Tax=Cladocopium goreaui TaxID=2562237 RepID=A0A9P1DBJ2_9DINO|nr:unnamed protein product [Cladocopium goreaui]